MTKSEAFRVGFYQKFAELGVSPSQLDAVFATLVGGRSLEKVAFDLGLKDITGAAKDAIITTKETLGPVVRAGAIGGITLPFLLGALVGGGRETLNSPQPTDRKKRQMQDLANEMRTQAQRLRLAKGYVDEDEDEEEIDGGEDTY